MLGPRDGAEVRHKGCQHIDVVHGWKVVAFGLSLGQRVDAAQHAKRAGCPDDGRAYWRFVGLGVAREWQTLHVIAVTADGRESDEWVVVYVVNPQAP